MHLIQVKSQEKLGALVEKIAPMELKQILKSKQFKFKWNTESKYEVYKLYITESEEIVGLMSLQDWPKELRLEIRLIESSKDNVGSHKKYDRIAGSLIAFACGTSFERGYNGFISLVPKTALRSYYINEYGMEEAGKSVYSDTRNSAKLLDKYL
ncbi:MAG: hypothetical protein KBH11_07515 [Bacteroidia bacterium]|nr:hypothetical protein [Bacteroidota bacterium]MBK7387693.1 hypothetical protein [Bacteroidota bacterium]MBL0072262.1 hypothetical protein [Bacteroidota bacterium]MBP9082908.1 hypothetical protein [Bacteroidia bacterium]